MIGRTLPTVTQHWIRRRSAYAGPVHFEIAHQMTGGFTCCGIDLHESKSIYDETRAKVTCRVCVTAMKANEDEVKRKRRQGRRQVNATMGVIHID